MADLPPLGTKESQTLEFKRADLLRSPKGRMSLLRNVVGMLNAEGGRILVGCEEEAGALTGLDPLQEEDRKYEAALRDTTLDRVEPPPGDDAVQLNWLDVPGGLVLDIRLQPPTEHPSPPFCLRDKDARYFYIRRMDRLRTMTWGEIAARQGSAQTLDDGRWFDAKVAEAAKWFPVTRRPTYSLVVALRARNGTEDLPLPDEALALVNTPPQDLIRPDGWSFATARPGNACWRRNKRLLESGLQKQVYRWLRVDQKGLLAFRTLLEHLQWDVPQGWRKSLPKARGMLYPYALVETTVSVLRLAARLWEPHLQDARVHAMLQLAGTRRWYLPPFGPYAPGYFHMDRWKHTEEDSISCGPYAVAARAFLENADRLAFELLADLYDEFGYPPFVIPCFNDAGRFTPPF